MTIRRVKPSSPIIALLVCLIAVMPLQAQDTFRTPDDSVVEMLEAEQLPGVRLAPGGEWVMKLHRPNMLSLEDIAIERLYLAGYRIDPATNSAALSRTPRYEKIQFDHLSEDRTVTVNTPEGAVIDHVQFAPGGEHFSFTVTKDGAVELWKGSIGSSDTRRITEAPLNSTAGNPCRWLNSDELLCEFIPPRRGEAPGRPAVPEGPVTEQTTDTPAPVRTFQDLLTSPHEVELFEYYFTSQLKRVRADDGNLTPIGEPAIFDAVQPAPDREHLFVSRTVRPFSFIVPDRWRINDWFPREMEIWTMEGEHVRDVASLGLAEEVPVDSMRTGPRDIHWQPGQDAALVWVEVDTASADVSERLYRLPHPQASEPEQVATLEMFHWRTQWYGNDTALITEVNRYPYRAVSHERTHVVDLSGEEEPRVLFDYNPEDAHADPGTLMGGRSVMADGETLFLRGERITDDGARPYIDRFDIVSGETDRLWESPANRYEVPQRFVGSNRDTLLTRSESSSEHPNYQLRSLDGSFVQALTRVEDPAPVLQDAQEHILRYDREDGVGLAARLHLPPGYDAEEDGPLPAILWAYPREFADPAAAGQMPSTANRFMRINGASPMFFLLRGYAVIENASMAIIGGQLGYPDEPNDTYIEQLVMSAEAAVEAAAETGWVDGDRVGIGGHSYGGFMTANVLAHTGAFVAGIARNAAFNRILTPFGFQNEQRTLWEAQDVYTGMSPFMYAHQIDAPILLIHGMDDPNPGTFPMQSERMYHALKGLGKPARLVRLPHEDHGYGARESIFHALVEMFEWFDAHVKGEE